MLCVWCHSDFVWMMFHPGGVSEYATYIDIYIDTYIDKYIERYIDIYMYMTLVKCSSFSFDCFELFFEYVREQSLFSYLFEYQLLTLNIE